MSVKQKKLKDGTTLYDVRVQYKGIRVGRRIKTTLTEAKRVEAKILNVLIEGNYDILTNTEDPKFWEYAEKYKKSIVWQKDYKKTLSKIKILVKYFRNNRLSKITEQDFINFRTKRLDINKSAATINRERACLLRMLNLAVNDEKYSIRKNPIRNVRAFKEKPAEDRVLTFEEYKKILESAEEYFRRIVFFACNTGMRRSEILDLKFSQIKLSLDQMEVELLDTKSGEREYVPLNESVMDLIWTIAKGKGIDLRNMKDSDKKKIFFTGMRGMPLKSVRKPMVNTFKKAGVKFRPFHTFRHFWTRQMFLSGVDPYTIMRIGRWRNLETMLRYCYTTRPEEHEAVNKLSKRLSQERPKIIKMWQHGANEGI